MKKDEKDAALSVEVGTRGASARVSETALQKIGQAAAWLFPRKDANARITAAIADRVAEKIKAGTPLDEVERSFVGRMFEREARSLANAEEVAERVAELMAEVKARLARLPERVDSEDSARVFVGRAETLASEIAESEVREVFARVVAGEICRPGSFSLRTIDTIRSLDPRVAIAFQELCNYVMGGELVLMPAGAKAFMEGKGLNVDMQFELQDAGLVSTANSIEVDFETTTLQIDYGDRVVRVKGAQQKTGITVIVWAPIEVLRLTRAGRDIARVLPFHPNDTYFHMILDALKGRSSRPDESRMVEWKFDGAEVWTEA